MLTFEEVGHVYRYNGERVPSVTQVMDSVRLTDYSMIPFEVLEKARQEGTAVHRMVEWTLKGVACELPEWLRAYLPALQRFLEDSGLELWQSEHQQYHPLYRYAGTPDIIGVPHRFKDARPAVFDVKRSFHGGPAIGVQTAAYTDQWNHEFRNDRSLQLKRRYGVTFRADGTYRCLPFESPDDRGTFLAALKIHQWKERYGR